MYIFLLMGMYIFVMYIFVHVLTIVFHKHYKHNSLVEESQLHGTFQIIVQRHLSNTAVFKLKVLEFTEKTNNTKAVSAASS